MNDLAERFVKGVWVPLPHTFRREVREATEAAFVGKNMITTLAGSTVLLEDVVSYNQKAEGPLVATFQTLSSIGHSGVAGLIQELYPGLVPYFIGCGSANPVHHTSYVLQFLAVILADEKEHETPVRVAMLAALFHDVALGLSKLPKITEAHIEEKTRDVLRGGATIEELKKYRNDAVKARKEHMQKGAEIAEGILTEYKTESKQLHKDQFNLEDLPEMGYLVDSSSHNMLWLGA